MRWFVLRDSKLMYYDNDSEEKLKGTIDIRAAKWDFYEASEPKNKHNLFFTLSLFSEQQLPQTCAVCFFTGRLWIIMKRRTLWILWQMRELIRCLLSHQRMQGVEDVEQQQVIICIWRDSYILLTSVFLCSGWFNVLSKVRVCTPEQLLEMSHEQANPKNAVVSL